MSNLADYYASSTVSPARLKAAGYRGVIRYAVAGSANKHLTLAEVSALHQDGLGIALVSEGVADRARAGYSAGHEDAVALTGFASSQSIPADVPLFYAVDFDASWDEVKDYFDGVAKTSDASGRAFGCYGSYRVIEGFAAAHPHGVCWQTIAWSGGKRSKHASVYQEAPDASGLAGVNVDAILKPLPLWYGSNVSRVTPTPKPEGLSAATRAAYRRIERNEAKRRRPMTAAAKKRTKALIEVLSKAAAI